MLHAIVVLLASQKRARSEANHLLLRYSFRWSPNATHLVLSFEQCKDYGDEMEAWKQYKICGIFMGGEGSGTFSICEFV